MNPSHGLSWEKSGEQGGVFATLFILTRKLGDLLTATITSGDTSATITDSKIKSTSIIDIYFENKVLAPENVTVSDGSIIVEISAQDTDTVVGIRVI